MILTLSSWEKRETGNEVVGRKKCRTSGDKERNFIKKLMIYKMMTAEFRWMMMMM